MYEAEKRTQIKRIPRQERSQERFERVLTTALRLFAAQGYESVSMREIAREAKMPIATVYQYFPMKLAIVREMWKRYTSTITETLAENIRNFRANGKDDLNRLIGNMVDLMAALQAENPAFIEIWSCVTASMELRKLDIEDTLQNARVITETLRQMYPKADANALFDRALVTIETANSTTRLALTLPEPHRARLLLALKATIPLLITPVTTGSDARPGGKNPRPGAARGKAHPKATPKH